MLEVSMAICLMVKLVSSVSVVEPNTSVSYRRGVDPLSVGLR